MQHGIELANLECFLLVVHVTEHYLRHFETGYSCYVNCINCRLLSLLQHILSFSYPAHSSVHQTIFRIWIQKCTFCNTKVTGTRSRWDRVLSSNWARANTSLCRFVLLNCAKRGDLYSRYSYLSMRPRTRGNIDFMKTVNLSSYSLSSIKAGCIHKLNGFLTIRGWIYSVSTFPLVSKLKTYHNSIWWESFSLKSKSYWWRLEMQRQITLVPTR